MSWLLSLLGLGGIGAALVFVPGLAARALRLLGIIADWFIHNPWAFLALALIAAVLAEHYEGAKWKRVAHSTEVALSQRTEALGITVQSLEALTRATRAQTAMVRLWSETATARQSAAQSALMQATERGRASEALALRIDAQRAQRGSTGQICHSSDAVMAARGAF